MGQADNQPVKVEVIDTPRAAQPQPNKPVAIVDFAPVETETSFPGVIEPAPITASHKGEDYASMDIPALAGRHTHYTKLARDLKASDEDRAQAKATAEYIAGLIKTKTAKPQ